MILVLVRGVSLSCHLKGSHTMNAIAKINTAAVAAQAGFVDRLGAIKAKIAALTSDEKELKELLTSYGPGEYEGKLFRATVTEAERNTLDMDAVRAKLSPQFIAAHTSATPTVTVRVVARTRKD